MAVAKPPANWLAEHERAQAARKAAGLVDGRHFSAYAAEVKSLLRSGDDDAAAGLLIRLVEAAEREWSIPLAGAITAPTWCHDQLQAVYVRAGMAEAARRIGLRRTRLCLMAEGPGRVATERMRRAAAREPERRRPPILSRRATALPRRWKDTAYGIGALAALALLGRACGP